jgi:cell division protein FtsQ|tara:strand:- start:329 stop:1075 length:747 start_codon:yes stop_codon:yes gene_type:complete
MLNSQGSIKKATTFVYALIFITFIFLCYQLMTSSNFPINEIGIKGEYENVNKSQVDLIKNKYIKKNFFAVNLEETREAFKKLPWIRDVSIRRDWNKFGLLVEIESHKPIARWSSRGLVNSYGEIFHAAYEDNLPLFVGPDEFVEEMSVKYYQINKILEKELMQIGTISLSNRLSWEIYTNNNMRFFLGKENGNNIVKKLNALIENYQFILSESKSRIEYVDLRYKDGFAVKKLNEKLYKTNKERKTTL